MTRMAEQPAASEDTPAVAPADTVQTIELGPHADIYPESVRSPEPVPAADDDSTDDEDAAATPSPEADAGTLSTQAAQPEPEPEKKSRRQRGEEAYQRGLSEGRAAAQREATERAHQDMVQRAQREANERIEGLFKQLQAPTFQQREDAGRQLADIHTQTLQGNQALDIARQQVHAQMAADFATVKELDGATDDDMRDLMGAASMSDFARKVHAIGRRGLEARITKLEAELQAARAHAVGARATPEAANGAGRIGQVVMHDLQNMPLKDVRKIEGTPEYDRMVQQYLQDRAAGRI